MNLNTKKEYCQITLLIAQAEGKKQNRKMPTKNKPGYSGLINTKK